MDFNYIIFFRIQYVVIYELFLETFYWKLIKQLIFLTTFYIFYESNVKIFLICFINNYLRASVNLTFFERVMLTITLKVMINSQF